MLGQSWKVALRVECILFLRQKQSRNVKTEEVVYQEMRGLDLSPGTQLFLNDVNITKKQGFRPFNLASKWKKLTEVLPQKNLDIF